MYLYKCYTTIMTKTIQRKHKLPAFGQSVYANADTKNVDLRYFASFNNGALSNVISWPDFQRLDRQNNKWRCMVMNTLITTKTIPNPIILSRRYIGDMVHYRVVDGGHRTRAILGFISNGYPLHYGTEKTYWNPVDKKLASSEINERFVNDLCKNENALGCNDEYRINLYSCTIPVVIYDNLTDDQERELFNRVNQTTDLTKHDKLNAVDSTFFDLQLRPLASDTKKLALDYLTMKFSKNQNVWLSHYTAFVFMAFDGRGADVDEDYLIQRLDVFEYTSDYHKRYKRITRAIELALTLTKKTIDNEFWIGNTKLTKMSMWLFSMIVKYIFDDRQPTAVAKMLNSLKNLPENHALFNRNFKNGNTLSAMKKRQAVLDELF